ncbi:MAG: endolytic transglycosylase MltG, partial [Acidobacteriota bacterium]
EGSTVRDVAAILDRSGLVARDDILRLSGDRSFVHSLGLHGPGLEGYLFPETYSFERMQDGATMLRAMVEQFRRHLPEGWRESEKTLGRSTHDLVILASIVEKEAVADRERPIIAGVFLNRLRLDMPLQSDPTAVYDLPDFSGPVTAEHLKRHSPYNTYTIKGLPAGPICNPGEKSLEAAFHPEKTSYLYFVSNNDGTHRFSNTIAEHQQAVNRYREQRNAMKARPRSDPATHGVALLEKKGREVNVKSELAHHQE